MNDASPDPGGVVADALQLAVRESGPTVLADGRHLENLLRDLAPGAPGATSLVAAAAHHDLGAKITLALASGASIEAAVGLAASDLARGQFYDPNACHWVAEAFAAALGYPIPATVPLESAPFSDPAPPTAATAPALPTTPALPPPPAYPLAPPAPPPQWPERPQVPPPTATPAGGPPPYAPPAWQPGGAGSAFPGFAQTAPPTPPTRASAGTRRPTLLAAVAVGVVVIIVAILVVVKVAGGHSTATSTTTTTSTTIGGTDPTSTVPATVNGPTHVPIAALASASQGVSNSSESFTVLSGQSPLTGHGKPQVLSIGAEFCPFCAAENWILVVALSQFGTFSNLNESASSATDNPASVPTYTFFRSSYRSQYLDFVGIETTGVDPNHVLQTPTAAQSALWEKLDSSQTIPFIDVGGAFAVTGASYSPAPIANKSFNSVASQVGDNATTVGREIDAGAGVLVRDLCTLTNNQPTAVCSAVAAA